MPGVVRCVMTVSIFVEGVDSELRLSNVNFSTLCSGLGIEYSPAGEIDPLDIDSRLAQFEAAIDLGETLGFSPSQIRNYYSGILFLATIAAMEGKKIKWG